MAVGDVFKKRRNLVQKSSGAPRTNPIGVVPGAPGYSPLMTYQQQWRSDRGRNPFTADYIKGVDDLDQNGNPMRPEDFRMNAGGPQSGATGDWGSQGQGNVLGRAAAALNAIQGDRQGYQPPLSVSRGPGFDADPYTTPQNIGTDTRYAGGIQGGGANRLQGSPPNPVYGGASGAWDPANGVGATGSWVPKTVPDINIWNNGRAMVSPEPGVYGRSQQELEGTYALRDKIDAIRERSQFRNPMVPNSPMQPTDPGVRAMQDGIDRGTRQGDIMFEPGATSSSGATRNFRNIAPDELNSVTAGTVNGYNGQTGYAQNPMRLSAEQKFDLAGRNAQRIVGGGAAADPTGMARRFGGAYGAGLDADAAAIASGTAVRTADGRVVRFTGTQDAARAAQTRGKSERETLRDRSLPPATEEERIRRAGADKRKAENAAKHQAFKDANGGMNYRQYDRMQNSNALTMKAVDEGRLSKESAMFRMQTRADKALRRAGNPMAMSVANGGRLFPDLLGGGQSQASQSTVSTNPIFGPGAGNTVENVNARAVARQVNVQNSPTLAAWGVSPDIDPAGFAEAVGQNLFKKQSDGKFKVADVSDDGILSIFNQVKAFDPTEEGKPPFPDGSVYSQMWALPESTPAAEIRKVFEGVLKTLNTPSPSDAWPGATNPFG